MLRQNRATTGSASSSKPDGKATRLPLHIHETEDELFHVCDGELDFQCAGHRTTVLAAARKRQPHSFVVRSSEARWLITTTGGDYERLSAPSGARHDDWPEPLVLTEESSAEIQDVGARHGIRFVGPPLE
jgi:hypothetical protein